MASYCKGGSHNVSFMTMSIEKPESARKVVRTNNGKYITKALHPLVEEFIGSDIFYHKKRKHE